MGTDKVDLERVRHDGELVIIRLDLGHYELRGSARNVLEPESRVVWATVVNELGKEGYTMVSPAEYAAGCNLSEEDVLALIWRDGTLFAVAFGDEISVPLPQRNSFLPEIEGN
jgi:hypothetical protein